MPPPLIWALGVPLILADAARDPFWRGVWSAVLSGQAPTGTGGDYTHLWRTAGEFFLLLLLALFASVSPEGGGLAVAMLVALWLLFLVSNPAAVGSLFKRFRG